MKEFFGKLGWAVIKAACYIFLGILFLFWLITVLRENSAYAIAGLLTLSLVWQLLHLRRDAKYRIPIGWLRTSLIVINTLGLLSALVVILVVLPQSRALQREKKAGVWYSAGYEAGYRDFCGGSGYGASTPDNLSEMREELLCDPAWDTTVRGAEEKDRPLYDRIFSDGYEKGYGEARELYNGVLSEYERKGITQYNEQASPLRRTMFRLTNKLLYLYFPSGNYFENNFSRLEQMIFLFLTPE